MTPKSERDMYAPVAAWLERFLKDRHRRAEVRTLDASRKSLSRIINDFSLQEKMPAEWPSWDIQVDIVGFAVEAKRAFLTLVECKAGFLNLRDLSQLLGYCVISKPDHAFLLSPTGAAPSLQSLLLTFNRLDVLRYVHEPSREARAITIGRWLESGKTLDWSTVITANGIHGARL
jgi:hypothetical protein